MGKEAKGKTGPKIGKAQSISPRQRPNVLPHPLPSSRGSGRGHPKPSVARKPPIPPSRPLRKQNQYRRFPKTNRSTRKKQQQSPWQRRRVWWSGRRERGRRGGPIRSSVHTPLRVSLHRNQDQRRGGDPDAERVGRGGKKGYIKAEGGGGGSVNKQDPGLQGKHGMCCPPRSSFPRSVGPADAAETKQAKESRAALAACLGFAHELFLACCPATLRSARAQRPRTPTPASSLFHSPLPVFLCSSFPFCRCCRRRRPRLWTRVGEDGRSQSIGSSDAGREVLSVH